MNSPIEIKLLEAIRRAHDILVHDFSAHDVPFDLLKKYGQMEFEFEPDRFGDEDAIESIDVFTEVTVLSYRVDILILAADDLIAVECDGHDYHERTKQQAAYDKSRDRELLLAGIPTLRFTGSEIHHAAERCAADVFAMARIGFKRHQDVLDLWHRAHKAGLAALDAPRSRTTKDDV